MEPVGIVEIGERLGVKPETVTMWRKRGATTRMPEPRWTFSGVPVWKWSEVKAWAEATKRLTVPYEEVKRRALGPRRYRALKARSARPTDE